MCTVRQAGQKSLQQVRQCHDITSHESPRQDWFRSRHAAAALQLETWRSTRAEAAAAHLVSCASVTFEIARHMRSAGCARGICKPGTVPTRPRLPVQHGQARREGALPQPRHRELVRPQHVRVAEVNRHPWGSSWRLRSSWRSLCAAHAVIGMTTPQSGEPCSPAPNARSCATDWPSTRRGAGICSMAATPRDTT